MSSAELASECFFAPCGISQGNKPLITAGVGRINSIIAASKRRGADHHLFLEQLLAESSSPTIKCHKDCVCTYTSEQHIKNI